MKLLNLLALVLLSSYSYCQHLDMSFNQIGKNKDIHYYYSNVLNMAVSPDQSIIIAGFNSDTSSPFYRQIQVMKLQPNGTTDSSFGTMGTSYIQLDTNYIPSSFEVVVNVQSNNKIILSTLQNTSSSPTMFKHFWCRLNANGILDSSFATQGIGEIPVSFFSHSPKDCYILPNDDILILFYNCSMSHYFMKLKANGTIDSTFGTNGYSFGCYSPINTLTKIDVQSDGKILVSGYKNKNTIMRYLSNGKIDSIFGVNGITLTQIDSINVTYDIMSLPNGSIYTAGYYSDTISYPYACAGDRSGGFIQRFSKDGNLDTTFNHTGTVTYQHPLLSPVNVLQFVGVHIINNQLIATGCYQTGAGELNYCLVGFHLDGSLDSTFGMNGLYITHETDSINWSTHSFIQNTNQLLLFGYSRHHLFPNSASGYLARYNFTSPSSINENKLSSNLNIEVYPNPAHHEIHVNYILKKTQTVSINLLDLNGRIIKQFIHNKSQTSGEHHETFDISDIAKNQVYNLQMKIDGKISSTKIILESK